MAPLQVEELQRLPANHWNLEERDGTKSLSQPQKEPPHHHLALGLLTMFKPLDCNPLLWQPRQTHIAGEHSLVVDS